MIVARIVQSLKSNVAAFYVLSLNFLPAVHNHGEPDDEPGWSEHEQRSDESDWRDAGMGRPLPLTTTDYYLQSFGLRRKSWKKGFVSRKIAMN